MIRNVLKLLKYVPIFIFLVILCNLLFTSETKYSEFSNEIFQHPGVKSKLRKDVEIKDTLKENSYSENILHYDQEKEEKESIKGDFNPHKFHFQSKLDKLLYKKNETNKINHAATNKSQNKFVGYVDKISHILNGHLTHVEDVKSPVENVVNVAEILVNPKQTKQMNVEFENNTRKYFWKIIEQAKTKPLHWIVVTDEFSRYQAGFLVASVIMKKLSQNVIMNVYLHDLHLTPLYFTLVDYMEIKAKKPEFTDTYRSLNETDVGGKYNHDFFFIAPLYHLAFTGLDRLIVLDAQDLEFQSDIAELETLFDKFKPSEIMGIGNDLSPYYMLKIENGNYKKKNPKTIFGSAGRFQGFNSGVVLYNFKRMRINKIFNRFLEPENLKWLLNKFEYPSILAEQDWMTNLGWLHPDLFYLLPCTYNAQTSIELMRNDTKQYFDDFHFCDYFRNLKIIHYNGCGSQPIDCGHADPQDSHKTKMHKLGAYKPPDLEGLDWMFFENIRTGKLRFEFGGGTYKPIWINITTEAPGERLRTSTKRDSVDVSVRHEPTKIIQTADKTTSNSIIKRRTYNSILKSTVKYANSRN